MPELTNRPTAPRFLSLGRLILIFLVGGLGALLHWLVLPEPTNQLSAETRLTADGLADAGTNASSTTKAPHHSGPSLGDILSCPYWQRTKLILAYLEGADAAATGELFQALTPEMTSIKRLPNEWQVQLVFIFSHWSALDGPQMMHAVQALQLGDQMPYLAFSLWAAQDWQGAREFAPQITANGYYNAELITLMAEAREDPAGVIARIKATGDFAHRSSEAMNVALRELSKANPEQAVAELFQWIDRDKARLNFQGPQNSLHDCLKASPAATMAGLRLLAERDPARLRQLLRNHDYQFMGEFPEYAADWLKFAEPKRQGDLKYRLTQATVQKDPTAALAAARSAQDPNEVVQVLAQLSKSDPKRWRDEISHATEPAQRQAQVLAGLHEFSRTFPQEGLALAQSLTDEDARSQALGKVASAWAAEHPKATWDEVLAFHPGATGDPAFAVEFVKQRVWTDPRGAVTLAKALPPDSREPALGEIFHYAASNNPLVIWENIDLLPANGTRQGLLASVLRVPIDTSNGHKSTAAVLDRWHQLPENDQTPMLISTVTETLYGIDATEASSWVTALPSGPKRDASTAMLANRIATDTRDGNADFDAAWRWAQTIEDPAMRFQVLRSTASPWLKADPNGLMAAIQSAALPEPDKANLRASFLLPTP